MFELEPVVQDSWLKTIEEPMILCLLVSFFVAFFVCLVCITQGSRHAAIYDESKLQRFHLGNIPRVGGMAILAGVSASWLLAAAVEISAPSLNTRISLDLVIVLCLSLAPAVFAGIYEDITQRLSVKYRLGLTALSAVVACQLLELAIPRLGLTVVDGWLTVYPWLGIALAFFAISGLPHAFNLIDGYNGLAAAVALLICIAIVHVSLQLGDRQLAAVVICLVGATAGFFVWNYPRGLIFAGDGGAYLWGIVIAIACILLVQRHNQVSPWFPMLLLIYPVWETVFSIYRKLVRGISPGVADALHFHQLIYRRIVRGIFHDDASRRMLMRNNRTSPYLWGFTLLTVVPAVLFWNKTWVLMLFCALFVICYVVAYLSIIRFKIPRWLRR